MIRLDFQTLLTRVIAAHEYSDNTQAMDSREGDTNSEEAVLLLLVCPKMVRYPLARSWQEVSTLGVPRKMHGAIWETWIKGTGA